MRAKPKEGFKPDKGKAKKSKAAKPTRVTLLPTDYAVVISDNGKLQHFVPDSDEPISDGTLIGFIETVYVLTNFLRLGYRGALSDKVTSTQSKVGKHISVTGKLPRSRS